jgi:hypothetical protein
MLKELHYEQSATSSQTSGRMQFIRILNFESGVAKDAFLFGCDDASLRCTKLQYRDIKTM